MEIKLEKINYENLKDINLTIEANTITGIISTNKKDIASLFNVLNLENKPKGNIYINQEKITTKNKKKYKKDIEYLEQNLDENKTVQEILNNHINNNHKNKEKRIKDTLKMIGIEDKLLKRKINTLSSGEKQQIKLALLLENNPKILLLQNPTKNLDTTNKDHILKLLKLMKLRYKKTIVIALAPEEMFQISDKICVIEDGKITKETDKYNALSNASLLKKCDMSLPQIIEFTKKIKQTTHQNIEYRDNINDLIKDIYRIVEQKKEKR